ncbi:TetR/AcrR family transcriptional regulator [Nocardioides sp. L-11A]|uniref:TetR/AcrR family transcriptional regulator n=1 Tax=Nocardioides sp. L-11A TaxID=3043848 RepID=UPI00249A0B20|nr:TetR/AcrR family transcriptional regulator [Nocardioides sp. L-11A]
MNRPAKPTDSETKDAIVTASARLFSERGYARTKVIDIAKAVGITPPSLYWHFGSKEEILFEYLRSRLELFDTRMESVLDGIDTPTDRLRAVATAHTSAQIEFRDQAQAVLSMTHSSTQLASDLSPEHLEEVRALTRRHIDRAREIVRAGVASGEFRVPDVTALAFAVLNVCEYTALWFRPEGGTTAATVAAANGEFAVRMATGGSDREGSGSP